MKLCLGTVQFGLQYGIASAGRPDAKDSVEIMNYAVENGFSAFDTASAYGSAEEIIGIYFLTYPEERCKIEIATKTPSNLISELNGEDYYTALKSSVITSIRKMNCGYLDYYLLHTSGDVFDESKINCMYRLKEDGLVKDIGVSVYTVEESLHAAAQKKIDTIQIPYNVLDRRLDKKNFFHAVNNKKIIFCRSILLQGLLTMDLKSLPQRIRHFESYLKQYHALCEKYGKTAAAFALGYIKRKKDIDYAIMGVDNIIQLKELIGLWHDDLPQEAAEEADNLFENVPEEVLDPRKWSAV